MSEIKKIVSSNSITKSLDITQQNIEQLKQMFPDIFSEGKINFDALKSILGETIDGSKERYNFSWNGKEKARHLAQSSSTATLRPSKDESVDWDTTENLFIEGDNLEVLKLLQKSYHKKVKMIYIDPPYNTGKDFVYKDNFRSSIKNYFEQTGQSDSEGKKLNTNSDTSGRYHTDWLNMIYPRLKLARNLLKDDGVIYISIDDSEVSNLRKVCDEIFGEDNFMANIVWQKKYAATNDAKGFSNMHDHILVYRKSSDFKRNLLPRTEEQNKPYKHNDDDGKGLWRSDNLLVRSYSKSGVYPIVNPNTGKEYFPSEGSSWRASSETMARWLSENRIYFGKDGKGAPQLKRYLGEVQQGRIPTTWWNFEEVGHNDAANKELKLLFEAKSPFDTPKPTTLIRQMLKISTEEDDLILDFFAGSSTSGHATLLQNMEDMKSRKFIMIQLPEECTEKSEAKRAGFNNIAEISRERLKRAGKAIRTENSDVDCGYKTLKLDETNIRPWDADFDNLELVLQQAADSIKADRSSEDVLYEILLKYGIELTASVEVEDVNGKQVFVVGAGALIVCLDDAITSEVVEGLAKLKEELNPETTQVVFKDAGFADSNVKTNAIQILKQAGIDDVKSI